MDFLILRKEVKETDSEKRNHPLDLILIDYMLFNPTLIYVGFYTVMLDFSNFFFSFNL